MVEGKEFRVSGVLEEQFSAEDRAIFADLRETGLLFEKPGKVSFIEVSTWCADCPVETVVEQISEKVPGAKVSAVKQLVEAELSQVKLAAAFVIALTSIIFVVGSLIMLLTMMGAVRERTQEIGIRMALGARRRSVVTAIIKDGSRLTAAGLVLGLLGAAALSRFISSQLHGVGVSDPLSLAGCVCVLGAVSILASLLPALRASRVDPAETLRAEH